MTTFAMAFLKNDIDMILLFCKKFVVIFKNCKSAVKKLLSISIVKYLTSTSFIDISGGSF